MDRRRLLQTGVAAALAAGPFAASPERWMMGQRTSMSDHAPIPRTNWAKNLHHSTDRVYAPTDPSQVPAIVKASARLKGLGSRHCFNDIADTTAAQISMREVKGIQIAAAAKTVTVGAGVSASHPTD